MKRKLRVGVLFGGRSGEHEVSLASARSVMDAIDRRKYEVVPIGITKEGRWLLGGDPWRTLRAQAVYALGPGDEPAVEALPDPGATSESPLLPATPETAPLRPAEWLGRLDVIFPLLHGPYGEDGTVQGLLELADIPYVGCGVASSAVGMDKALMKAIFRAEGLPVVNYLVVKRRDWERSPEAIIDLIERELGYPCFAKPANLGSSVGISKIHDRSEVAAALNLAARYDRKILVEWAVPQAREIECSVLGNDEPIASVVGEIIPSREFYSYEAKYLDDASELLIPAPLPPEVSEQVRDLAVRAFLALDCAGLARVDFLVERDTHAIYLNELNTIPGFTPISMYPKLWEATGLSYPELIDRLIQLALDRYEEKQRTATSI